MIPFGSKALALELQPHSPTQWIATYYPMVATPAGRWADVTWVLHRCLLTLTADPLEPTRWLEARSPDPDHPCYANPRVWATELAAGYAAALAVHDAETTEQSVSLQQAQQLRDRAVVVPAGQLSEWVLNDLKDETANVHG